ncbi:MAG: MFS transporter [Alphaproteobacteria bacterium]|nr:MFS transporter [Alphaproteobacteria bacterium]
MISTAAMAPFRIRSFRFQWPADLATSWAMEMETLILGWYVLVETNSVLLLTVFGSLQYLGTLCAPMIGVAGDRWTNRNLLCVMRAAYTVLALILMVLAFTDTVSPNAVLVIAALNGIVRPSDISIRNAVLGETMPRDQLMEVMSVSRTTADSARIAGALVGAGLVAALGMGPAYVVISALYATSFLLTLGVARVRPEPATLTGRVPRASPWHDLGEAVRYIWRAPHLAATMVLAFVINLTAYPVLSGLLPYVAKEVYHVGQAGLAYLLASYSFGALLGAIALSMTGATLRPARMMIGSCVAWYSLMLVFAHLEHSVGGVVVLVIVGLAQSLCMVPMSVMLLRNSSAQFRGRVMGIRALAVNGLPLGLLAAGPLVASFGFAAAATLFSVIGLVITVLIALRWRADLWRSDAPANAR